MEFRQLRSFVEVVRQGSFTQAAQVRHASQSTISKQVAQLEQSLGVQVLERNGPHVRLTDAGAVVFRRAEEMLRLRRDLLSELDDLSQLNRGELRLGLPLLGADALFAQRFAEYRRRYPNIAVHLVEGGSKTMEQAVLAGELELAGSLTPADDGFDYQPFCNEPLDVLLPYRASQGRCRQRRPRRTGGQPVPALPAELHPQRPPAARLPGGRLQPARRRPQRPGRLPRRAGGGQPGGGAATTGDRSRDRTPGSGAGPAQGAGPALGHRLHLAPWRLPVAGGAGLAGAAARATAGGKPGVGRITTSSAEATADNAWRRYSPYRLLPPRVGRITASRLSAAWAGVSADNAWGVIRPTVCSFPVSGE